jgi:hypothetical protein
MLRGWPPLLLVVRLCETPHRSGWSEPAACGTLTRFRYLRLLPTTTPISPASLFNAEVFRPLTGLCLPPILGALIPMRDIKRYCDTIATAFKPRKIILFGSYAYGKPDEDSDVDVMVVMPKKLYRSDLGYRIRMKTKSGAIHSANPAGESTECGRD